MSNRKLFLMIALFVALVSACAAPMDTSKARSRQVIETGGIVSAEELRVAEYLSYYKQSFPEPVNSTLGLDLRLGNIQVPVEGGIAWLQIGIQAKSAQGADIAPLNLAIVIDKSGSMDSPEKMPYLKQSLRTFLNSLASNDIVAIVAFSTSAELIQPASKVGDGKWIENAVNRLQPGGSTNLNDGLMMGFQEVYRNFDVRRNNRVILLTDGLANTGTTDPTMIADAARQYNDRGIYLSSIGLGKDFNDPLLSQLATQGKGAYHFVDSAAEMDKIFKQDVSGLIQKAASDVYVTIRPDTTVRVDGLTGYDSKPPAGTVQVKMRDMGTGDSQVLLAQLYVNQAAAGQRNIGTIELRYRDLFSNRDESIQMTVTADAARVSNYNALWDVEVYRNVTIQRTAEGLKEIDRLYKAQRYLEAWQLAYQLEQDLRTVARLTNDQQMVKDADMMRTYQDTLSKWVQNQTRRPPQPLPEESDSTPDTSRSRQMLPTLTPSAIEIK
jgi:Ca-activated chloride channel family protein